MDLYSELIMKGYTDSQVTAKIIELYKEVIDDADDGIIIYSALAALQLSRSSLITEVKTKVLSLIENSPGLQRWTETGKSDYKARLGVLKKLSDIVTLSQSTAMEQYEAIRLEYDSLTYSVYQLADHNGNVVYIGSTAFPEKRARYMNYIAFNELKKPKGLFGVFNSSVTPEEAFWSWFSQNEQKIYQADDINDSAIQELYARIHKVHPDLTIEFGKAADGKKTMAISADGISELFSYVIRLCNELKLLSNWIVFPFRQRLDNIGDLEIRMDGNLIKGEDILFVSRETENRIDLDICVKNMETIDNPVINAIFLMLDSAVGEYDVVSKIGNVDIKPYSSLKNNDQLTALVELPRLVDSFQ
jgi:hypothetical protein